MRRAAYPAAAARWQDWSERRQILDRSSVTTHAHPFTNILINKYGIRQISRSVGLDEQVTNDTTGVFPYIICCIFQEKKLRLLFIYSA